jgi:hypothetical protein
MKPDPKMEIYKRTAECAFCNKPVEIKSFVPFGPDDDIGVLCDSCAEAELGPLVETLEGGNGE